MEHIPLICIKDTSCQFIRKSVRCKNIRVFKSYAVIKGSSSENRFNNAESSPEKRKKKGGHE